MRKRVFGRRFKRDIKERKALFRGLMRELVLRERIKTTEAKAKAIRSEIEKHVTMAKRKGEAARYFLQQQFSPEIVQKIITDIAPRFAQRPGGYVRLMRIGTRTKDNARMVMIEWVEGKKIKDQKSNIKNEEVEIAKGKTQVQENEPETKKEEKPKKEKGVKKKNEKPNKSNKSK